MSKTVTCNTLVWLREQQFEAGTKFAVVDEPKDGTDVDPTTADRWEMNGWLVGSEKGESPIEVARQQGKKLRAAGEGA